MARKVRGGVRYGNRGEAGGGGARVGERSRARGNRRVWLELRRRALDVNEWSAEYRDERIRRLRWICGELAALGVELSNARELRSGHVESLAAAWRLRGMSAAAMRNRLSVLRWWAEQAGVPGVVGGNERYGARPGRVAKGIVGETAYRRLLGRAVDPLAKMSFALQWEFGLSPEESVRMRPAAALRDGGVWVKAGWDEERKRGRLVRVRWESQRELFESAARVATKAGIVPEGRSAVEQIGVWLWEARRLGVSVEYGLRYGFARRVLREDVGVPCPAEGGPQRSAMDEAARGAVSAAVRTIAAEMGLAKGRVRHSVLGYEREAGRDGGPDVAAELRSGYFGASPGVGLVVDASGAAR